MSELFEKFKYLYPAQLDEAIIQACITGNLDEVDYLVTSFELKVHTNLNQDFNEAFDFACVNGHLPVVKYLVNCPKLELHINNDNIKCGFQSACYYRKMDIVNYLIMDFNMELNDEIKSFLNLPNEAIEPVNIFKNHKDSFREVLNMFEARELEKQLNAVGNNKKEKKPKI